jgi:hypothetical protein
MRLSRSGPYLTGFFLYLELNQLTGVAAILTFPLDIEVVEMEERQAKEEAEDHGVEANEL